MAALGALVLSGCAAPQVEPAFGQVTARFVASRDDQVIDVSSLGSRAISSAELVLPDGTRTAAFSIDSVRDPEWDGTAEPPGAASSTINSSTAVLSGVIASVAHIRVTHPADYAAAWQQARIALRFGFGADATSELIAAPPPPK